MERAGTLILTCGGGGVLQTLSAMKVAPQVEPSSQASFFSDPRLPSLASGLSRSTKVQHPSSRACLNAMLNT